MQLNQLEKFLEFINLDLSKAPQSELMQAATFVSEASMPPQSRFRFDLKDIAPKLEQLLANDGALLKKTQARLQAMLTEIEEWSEDQFFLQDDKKPDKHGNIFHSLFKMKIKAEVNLLAQVTPVRNAEMRDRDPKTTPQIPIRIALTFGELESAIVFYFCGALEGLGVDALKICPVCNKWFLKQTKRLKLFCSNSCAAKSGNKKRYLLRQASMFRKSDIGQ